MTEEEKWEEAAVKKMAEVLLYEGAVWETIKPWAAMVITTEGGIEYVRWVLRSGEA